MTTTKTAENGRSLKPHDGFTEWSVCGKCGEIIDWTNDVMFGPGSGRDRDDTSCPHCGHDDTAYLYADDEGRWQGFSMD